MFPLEKSMQDSFKKEQTAKGLERKLMRIKEQLRLSRVGASQKQLQEVTQVLEGYIALKKTLKSCR